MKIEILASYKVLICYDDLFYCHSLENKWASIDEILDVVENNMKTYGFIVAAVTDATTGELLITVEGWED